MKNCLSPFVPSKSDCIMKFIEMTGLTEGNAKEDTLLDIGCGDGRVCIISAKETGKIKMFVGLLGVNAFVAMGNLEHWSLPCYCVLTILQRFKLSAYTPFFKNLLHSYFRLQSFGYRCFPTLYKKGKYDRKRGGYFRFVYISRS